MKQVSMMIHTSHLYTMSGSGVGYRNNETIVIDNGKIVGLGPRTEMEQAYQAAEVIDAKDYMVLPGLIDGHMHSRHGFLRGVAQDMGHDRWMMGCMAPFEVQSTPEARLAGARVTMGEAILHGTTTIGDDGPDMAGPLSVVDEYGARGNCSIRIRDALQRVYEPGELYEFSNKEAQKSLDSCLELMKQYDGRDNGRIRIRFGPQGCDFVSMDMLGEVVRLCREKKSKIHMHLQQGSRETEQMLKRYGRRSIPILAEKGYLDENFVGIHLTDATDDEVRTVAQSGAAMILCSNSIGVIRGEIPPAKLFQDAGGRVGLGTDQCAGNNCHNIIAEMKMTAVLNKCKYVDPAVMPAWKVLRMATIEGARALGIDDVTGSIEVGKDADIIFVDLHRSTMSPVLTYPMRNMVPNLVYSANGSEVDTVMVRGRILVRHHVPQTFDMNAALEALQREAEAVGKRAAPKFFSMHGENAVFMENGQL